MNLILFLIYYINLRNMDASLEEIYENLKDINEILSSEDKLNEFISKIQTLINDFENNIMKNNKIELLEKYFEYDINKEF